MTLEDKIDNLQLHYSTPKALYALYYIHYMHYKSIISIGTIPSLHDILNPKKEDHPVT